MSNSSNHNLTRRNLILQIAASAVSFDVCASTKQDFSLNNTVFEKVGKSKSLDPYLLFAIALIESARGRKKSVGPWPYALRAERGYYPNSFEEAKLKLQELQRTYGNMIDVGMMQLNLRWHSHRFNKAEDLLNPYTNVSIAADVLNESLQRNPNNIVIGIGQYHHIKDVKRTKNYGERVIAVYENLQILRKASQQ